MPPLKDLLGKPGEGIHFHFLGLAVVDVLLTVVVGSLIGWWISHEWIGCVVFAVLLALIGEFLHVVIGVDTVVVKWLKFIYEEMLL